MIIALSQLIGKQITLIERRTEAPGVETFVFEASNLRWESGQYFVYGLPAALLDPRSPFRPFSAASAPGGHKLQITTRITDNPSRFKTALARLRPGDKLRTFGPYGSFTFKESAGPSVLLIGGIGATPAHAMLQELSARHSQTHLTVLYSTRDQPVVFQDDFTRAVAQMPNCHLHILSGAPHFDAALITQMIPNYSATTFYVTGPKPMVKGTASILRGLGLPASRIRRDALKGYPWGA